METKAATGEDFGDLMSGFERRVDAAEVVKQKLAVTAEDNRTPILWHSNAPWVGTGYGQQSALFVPLLEQMGYRCAFSAFYGLRGSRLGWVAEDGQSFIVYPGTDIDIHGNDVLGAHAKHWFGGRHGMVIALTDPWVLDARIVARLPMLAWTPVDHDPLMPRTHDWLNHSKALPVAMSRYGEEKLQEAGHEKVYYAPHGYDPAVFKPADRMEARAALGLPKSAFIVGMVAANLGSPSRKSFSQAITAFGEFQKNHKDALLYLHTKLENRDGEDIPMICKARGVKASSSDQYAMMLGTPASIVSALMSCFDVLLAPSMGEGFGIPVMEAQACGTPCIVNGFSAQPEVAPIEAGNWHTGGQEIWTPFESFQQTPDIADIVDRLEQAYSDSEQERTDRRVSVYKHVKENYQAAYVAETYWKPLLEDAEIELSWRRQLMSRY